MPHESFFEAQLIEFTILENDSEKTLVRYNSFDEIPTHLKEDLDKNRPILFHGKRWTIVDIDKDLRAHGKGIRLRIRLEPYQNQSCST